LHQTSKQNNNNKRTKPHIPEQGSLAHNLEDAHRKKGKKKKLVTVFFSSSRVFKAHQEKNQKSFILLEQAQSRHPKPLNNKKYQQKQHTVICV
jgi:hypothetical protein